MICRGVSRANVINENVLHAPTCTQHLQVQPDKSQLEYVQGQLAELREQLKVALERVAQAEDDSLQAKAEVLIFCFGMWRISRKKGSMVWYEQYGAHYITPRHDIKA
jgi:hypothetical protein